jgi:hypothetical protein
MGGCGDSLMKVRRKIGENLAKREQVKKAQRHLGWSNQHGQRWRADGAGSRRPIRSWSLQP